MRILSRLLRHFSSCKSGCCSNEHAPKKLSKAEQKEFFQSLALTSGAGINVKEFLRLYPGMASTEPLRISAYFMEPRFAKGMTLSAAMKETGMFDDAAISACNVGELTSDITAAAKMHVGCIEACEATSRQSSEKRTQSLALIFAALGGVIVGAVLARK